MSARDLQKLLLSARFQIVGAVFFVIFLPAFARSGFNLNDFLDTPQIDTVLGIALAVVLGYFFYSRISVFPSAESERFVFFVFTFSFLFVAFIYFMLRLEYTRLTLLIGYFCCCVWFLTFNFIRRKNSRYRLSIVPIGRVDDLETIDNVEWVRMNAPEDFNPNTTGLVADLRADLPAEWEHFLAQKALTGIQVFHVKQIKETLLGKVEIEHLSENTLGSLNPNQAYLEIKQTIDWISALVVLIVFSPIFLLIAISIKLDSPGPVLFKQVRKGYRGKNFVVYKFRTMTDSKAQDRATVPADETGDGEEQPHGFRHSAITRDKDARITRVGRFLRRTRIDELPQILNILRDEMSWIGPRPEALVLSEWYEKELPFYSYRHIVRPGISGWAQVSQGHVAGVDEVLEKLHYDFYYIKNFSMWLDVLIVLRTLRTVFTGHGAK
jgi:lipopolysaccharide/colanic/teichoic acid biosynthesis glycosyltransferase